ncbi:MAG: hypothetical protein ACRD3W_18455, partial [Terriglobales bacterium]
MSALNWLAMSCGQYAFDFSSLVGQNPANTPVGQAMPGPPFNDIAKAVSQAQGAAAGASGAGGASVAAGAGAGAGAGAVGAQATAVNQSKLQSALKSASSENQNSGLVGGSAQGSTGLLSAHVPSSGLPGALHPSSGTSGGGGGSSPGDPGVPAPPSAGEPFALGGAAAPGAIHSAGHPGGSGGKHRVSPQSLKAGVSPKGGRGSDGGSIGSSLTGAANSQNSSQEALAAGRAALTSNGLGLRMNSDGSLTMNQDALRGMQQQMQSFGRQGDPTQLLQNALQQAQQQRNPAALEQFIAAAQQAGVFDTSTQAALQAILNKGSAQSISAGGVLQVPLASSIALASGGNMPSTGLPSSTVVPAVSQLAKPDSSALTPAQMAAMQRYGLAPAQVQAQLRSNGIDPATI